MCLPMVLHLSVLCLLLGTSTGQMPGTMKKESPPPLPYAVCTRAGGCTTKKGYAVLDANWRWVHTQTCSGTGPQSQCNAGGNCYTDGKWDAANCKDPKTCTQKCALEGVPLEEYASTYGVTPISGGLKLRFLSMGPGGQNVGSRLYLMDSTGSYIKIKLKNREFTFDVDVSELPCGLNGAVYFSEMEADGGKGGSNLAGAPYGTGYCDAQCPHDIKFMNGEANVLDWNVTGTTGRYGACCAEMDIWEANSVATAYTVHGCTMPKTYVCEGIYCGDNLKHERYQGVCDKDGCDFNSYRMGEKNFFGPGPTYTVDSKQPITVVTQFITADGTDTGELYEVRRYYVQNGKVIPNSHATVLGSMLVTNSITNAFCNAQKSLFGDPRDFQSKGSLKSMGDALGRGMVLVMSLWDDNLAHMLWLDSAMGKGGVDKPGILRGPCEASSGNPQDVRQKYPSVSVSYSNIMYGEINSTYTAGDAAKPANGAVPVGTFHVPSAQQAAVPPVVAQPVVVQPEVAQPKVPQAVVAQPAVTQPMVPQIVVAQPEVAQPVVPQPVVPTFIGGQPANQPAAQFAPAPQWGSPAAKNDDASCATEWQGCQGNEGGGCCANGCTCTPKGDTYSQCVPDSGSTCANIQQMYSTNPEDHPLGEATAGSHLVEGGAFFLVAVLAALLAFTAFAWRVVRPVQRLQRFSYENLSLEARAAHMNELYEA